MVITLRLYSEVAVFFFFVVRHTIPVAYNVICVAIAIVATYFWVVAQFKTSNR